jgi:hypothetical protein
LKNNFIFRSSKFYKQNIKSFSKNLKRVLNKRKKSVNELKMIDYGCGNCDLHNFLNFKIAYLYDPNFKNYKIRNKKNFYVINKLNSIKSLNFKVDLIIINSVIQYIEPPILKVILKMLLTKLKKGGLIIISDIPDRPRIFELLSPQNFFLSIKLFFYFIKSKNYLKINFFYYKKYFFNKIFSKNKVSIKFEKNFNFITTRYSVIISK